MITAIQTDIIAIAVLTAIVCSIPGTFLVIRQSAVDADTANRSSVFGFSLGLAFLMQLSSPLLILYGTAAACIGLWGVKLTAARLKITKEDSSIILPGLLLAVGVIIITYFSKITYLDIETILLGELALLPFDRLVFFGYDIGSQAVYSLLAVMAINLLFIMFFYKEFKSSCVDREYARSIKLRVENVDILFPFLIALTLAVSFQTAGAFMTTAFLLGPAATAHYYTKRLSAMIMTAIVLSLVACMTGYAVAHSFDTSIASAIVCVIGALFVATVIAAPETGLITKLLQRGQTKHILNKNIVIVHLLQYGAIPADIAQMSDYLNWNKRRIVSVIAALESDGSVTTDNGTVLLTDKGRGVAAEIFAALG